MKLQNWLIGILLLVLGQAVMAQDVMIFKDGEEVLAKVLEITPDLVKYKVFSNLDGPTVSVEREKVFMIKYENGAKEVLNPAEDKPADPKPADPIPADPNSNNNGPTVTYSRVQYDRKRIDHEIYNLVKLNPLALFNGDLPVYYERRLGDQLSAEAGVGLTYSFDLWNKLFGLSPSYETHTPRLGYSARVALHFFPNKYIAAPEEWYFGPEIAYRHYGTTLSECGGYVDPIGVKESRNYLDFKVHVGYILFVTDAVFFDFYAGFGMRYRDYFFANCDYSGPVTVIQQPTHDAAWVPAIATGIKFGFGW